MKGFKYYIRPADDRDGWEVMDDDGVVMGRYATVAEAQAAVTVFVRDDAEALKSKWAMEE